MEHDPHLVIISFINIDLTFTAHHKKDQIETLIMQFINASDFISMIGIREEMGRLRRPFLECDKSNILKYAKNIKKLLFFNKIILINHIVINYNLSYLCFL